MNTIRPSFAGLACAAASVGYAAPVLAAAIATGDATPPVEVHGFVSQGAILSTEHDYLARSRRGSVEDPTFLLAFRARVVPLLRTYPRIKIWHCGCATGEEVFAMAILLTKESLYDRATIFAMDLSPRALELAAQGIHDADRAPRFGQNYASVGGTSTLDRYYTAAYDRISLRDFLTKNVVFFQRELVSDHVFAEVNVVFCRNVLIYFNPPLRERVLEKIAQSLRPGGFLCLGSSERLAATGVGALFTEVDRAQRIYRLAA